MIMSELNGRTRDYVQLVIQCGYQTQPTQWLDQRLCSTGNPMWVPDPANSIVGPETMFNW